MNRQKPRRGPYARNIPEEKPAPEPPVALQPWNIQVSLYRTENTSMDSKPDETPQAETSPEKAEENRKFIHFWRE